MTKKQFAKKVRKEIEKLKTKLTNKQKKKLVLSKFNHIYYYSCLYGLLFENSYGEDAIKFQKKSYHYITAKFTDSRPNQLLFKNHDFSKGSDYTALEKYFFMLTSKKQRLNVLRYIKGTIDELEIKLK